MVFPTQFNEKTRRGIGNGFGVCSCDETLQCKCDKPKNPSNKNKSKSKTNKMTSTIPTLTQTPENMTTFQPNLSRHTGKLFVYKRTFYNFQDYLSN